ncbi:Frag1/DRAM/Sfk1 family protein [Oceanobacter mangrovi]|uniref:Frag1/DRAM/Sfk1 family protein n=1 Tax=Oceanobacter mangrovi TaxID=2862510 RepID=UPI001C8D4267|nr:Frag1/DRAM/Sfk1 family protein [Oceanobacter mangrovi]
MSFGRHIALLSFLLSMGTIAITYWVAAIQGTAEICNPFLDGCTDITHTGMKGDAGFIFRGGMIAACVYFVIWWLLMSVWLQPVAGKISRGFMSFFGILAAVGLAVGTAVLLPEKSATNWPVHVRGANLFFQGMLVALTINYVLIFKGRRNGLVVPSFWFKTALMVLLWLQFVVFAGVTIGVEMNHGKRLIEWWATLFIGCYFLTSWWDWKNLRVQAG